MDQRVVPAPARSGLRWLVAAAALVVVLAGLGLFAGMVSLLGFSALVAVLARRFQLVLLGRGMRPWLALTVTVGAIIAVLVVLFGAAVMSVVVVVATLSDDAARIGMTAADAGTRLGALFGIAPASMPSIDAGAALSAARQLLGSVLSSVTSLAMAVLIVTYLLLDAGRLRERMLGATSADLMLRYDTLATELVTYIRVRAILGAAAALADTVLLFVIGVPNAPLWGMVSFLFSFVPNLGFILALVPPTVLAFFELGPWPAVAVVAGYTVINLAFDYVLQPRMMQVDLDLSPVVVIVTILVWTLLIGPMGALLAVPLTITLRAILVPFPGARWFVALLGPVPGEVTAAEAVPRAVPPTIEA